MANQNSFTRVVSGTGFTDTLVYQGKTYVKRYKRDRHGWSGLDKSWDEDNLPDDLVDAIRDNDEQALMDLLSDE